MPMRSTDGSLSDNTADKRQAAYGTCRNSRSSQGQWSGLQPLEPRLLLTAFYVDAATGLDSNPGTIDEPLLTIQAALDAAADHGSDE